MPSNPPPPRAHNSRGGDALPDSPQRLPRLTTGSSAATSPQRPSSSTGTGAGSVGPPHRPLPLQPSLMPAHFISASPFPTPSPHSSSPHRGMQRAGQQSLTPSAAGGAAPRSPRVSSAGGRPATTTTATHSLLPAWVHLELATLPSPSSNITGVWGAMTVPTMHTTTTTTAATSPLYGPPGSGADRRPRPVAGAAAAPSPPRRVEARVAELELARTYPAESSSPTDAPYAGAAPPPPRLAPSLLQPPPLTRVASAATLYNSAHGLAPLIEWVPVPGWDDTEMCRGESGGYFKADAATGRPYRVNWVRPRDLSRPPTVSSSGAATPVSPSPLPMQVPAAGETQAAPNPSLAPPTNAVPPAAVNTHRHLHFEMPSPNTAMTTPTKRPPPAAASPSAEVSPVTIRDTKAAVVNEEEEAPAGQRAASAVQHEHRQQQQQHVSLHPPADTPTGPVAPPLAVEAKSAHPRLVPGKVMVAAPPPTAGAAAAAAAAVEVGAEADVALLPSSSHAYPWLSSSNRASGATSGSYDDHRAATRLAVSPEVMLRRSLPVVSDGYDAHGCSVFTALRRDGTVSLVMLEPYPRRPSPSPWPARPPPAAPGGRQLRRAATPTTTPTKATMAAASPPRSPPSPPSKQPTGHVSAEARLRLSLSRDPVQRSHTGSPRTSPPAPGTTAATSGFAAMASSSAPSPSGLGSVVGLWSGPPGAALIPPPRVPNLRQPPPSPPLVTAAAAAPASAPTATPVASLSSIVRPRARSGIGAAAAAAPPPPAAAAASGGPRGNGVDVEREASSLNTAVAAASTLAVHGHSSSLTSPNAARTAPAAPASSLVVWTPLASSGPPAGPSRAAAAAPTYVPPPPPLLAATAGAAATAATPTQRAEVSAFVAAAARARGTCPSASSSLPSANANANVADTPHGAPSRPPLPRLSVVALAAAEDLPAGAPPSATAGAATATAAAAAAESSAAPTPPGRLTTVSLLPSWCLNLVDTLLTSPSPHGGARAHGGQQQQQQQPPAAPTPTSGTTTGGTTAGSDVDSRLWSAEMRNGVQIGWTHKSVTAAGRAREAAQRDAAAAHGARGEAGTSASPSQEGVGEVEEEGEGRSRDDAEEDVSPLLSDAPDAFRARSSPLPFSLATPDGGSMPDVGVRFLQAASQPEGSLEETEEGRSAAYAQQQQQQQQLQQQQQVVHQPQRRFTRASILTHSGLNAEPSLNDVAAALAAGSLDAPLRANVAVHVNATPTAFLPVLRVGAASPSCDDDDGKKEKIEEGPAEGNEAAASGGRPFPSAPPAAAASAAACGADRLATPPAADDVAPPPRATPQRRSTPLTTRAAAAAVAVGSSGATGALYIVPDNATEEVGRRAEADGRGTVANTPALDVAVLHGYEDAPPQLRQGATAASRGRRRVLTPAIVPAEPPPESPDVAQQQQRGATTAAVAAAAVTLAPVAETEGSKSAHSTPPPPPPEMAVAARVPRRPATQSSSHFGRHGMHPSS